MDSTILAENEPLCADVFLANDRLLTVHFFAFKHRLSAGAAGIEDLILRRVPDQLITRRLINSAASSRSPTVFAAGQLLIRSAIDPVAPRTF